MADEKPDVQSMFEDPRNELRVGEHSPENTKEQVNVFVTHVLSSGLRSRKEEPEEFHRVRSGAQGFFVRRADGLVGATAADETRLGWEFPGANVRCGFLNHFLRCIELLRIAGGRLDLVVL